MEDVERDEENKKKHGKDDQMVGWKIDTNPTPWKGRVDTKKDFKDNQEMTQI